MSMILLSVLAVGLAAAPLASKGESFFIGTYTSPSGSKGIYRASLDPETGRLSDLALAGEAANPSFLALHPNGKVLYAVDEEDKGGSVSAYAVLGDGNLNLLNTRPVEGSAQCHVEVNPAATWLFTASYGDGYLSGLGIEPDGRIGENLFSYRHSGTGPDAERQSGPHMHSSYVDPSGRFLYACDLGTDDVIVLDLHSIHSSIRADDIRTFKVPPGSGPRHLAFSANGRFVYVNGEMGGNVTVFERDPKTGSLSSLQTVSTLNPGEKGGATAEIVCHPNGKWLYVSNRSSDTIAVFKIRRDGELERTQVAPAEVKTPRGFALDPSGRWIVVAGQNSNDIAVLAIDHASGKLSDTGQRLALSHPVCILFRPS